MTGIALKTRILPDAQKELWPLLKEVPGDFVLYGGTAVALRYGHRESVDFDFFSTHWTPHLVESLLSLPAINKFSNGEIEEFIAEKSGQSVVFNLTMTNKENVSVSFVESTISIPGAIKAPDVAIGNNVLVASPEDLMATKVYTLGKRVTTKDFVDIATMIKKGQSLSKGFAGAMCFRQNSLERDFLIFDRMCKSLQNPDELKYLLSAQEKDATEPLQAYIPEIMEIIPAAARKIDLERERENSKLIKLSRDLTYGIRRERKCQER